ncbi:MAG: hypothetical protein WC346_21715 [Methanogenium sp.]|jgi:hypothetical protein
MNNIKKLIFLLIIISSIIKGQFSGGDGSIDNPYLIATARQLDSIRYRVPNSITSFKLINDINLDDLGVGANGNWTTISISSVSNAHIRLDGNFYTIRNMKQYNKINQDQGLFKNISATSSGATNLYIKNLTLKNFQIIDTTGTRNFGAGRAIGFLIQSMNLSSSHKLLNIIIDSSKIDLRSSNTSYSIYVGGLIATGSFDSVYQCAVINSSIKVVNAGQYSTVGAIYGGNNSGSFKIYKTFAYNVTIDWKGTNTSSGYLGAFSGRLTNGANNGSTISDCYFIGNIKVNTTSGGTAVGFSYSIETNSISTYRCYSVVNNISTHAITKRGWTLTSRNIYYSYFNSETIGTTKGATTYSNVDSSYYKNTSQLKDVNTYETWDFLETWTLNVNSNDGYPYLKWRGSNSISFLTPSQNSIYMLEEDQDTINLSWNTSSLDSTKLYFFSKYFIDSTTVYNQTFLSYKIPSDLTYDLSIVIKLQDYNLTDTLNVFILGLRSLEIDTLYIEKQILNTISGGKSSLDKVANKTSTSFGDVLTIKSISTGIDTINFYIEQENGVWYYLGKKKADTTHTPNVTYFTYVLKDHSPKCTCHKAGAKERGGGNDGGGGDPDKEGDTPDPFTPPNEFVFEKEFDEKQAFLSVSGPFSAHPYKNMVCNAWIGTAWDLQYILDVSCGWVSVWKAEDCKEGHRSISGWFNGVVSYGTTSSEEFHNNIYIYKEFITSGAFTYSISGYLVKITSILTKQSRTFDMKKLDVLGGGFSAGGSGAIHPPFAVSKMNFGGKPYLLIGTKAEGRLLNPYRDELPTGVVYSLGDVISTGPPFFYMFAMDSRFAYTLIQHRGSYSPAWGTYGAGGAGGANFSVNTQKTRYRGVHSKNGIWKYGNSQGIKP